MNRRSFLSRLGLAGVGALVAPVLPKFFDLGAAWQRHDLIWSIQATISEYLDWMVYLDNQIIWWTPESVQALSKTLHCEV